MSNTKNSKKGKPVGTIVLILVIIVSIVCIAINTRFSIVIPGERSITEGSFVGCITYSDERNNSYCHFDEKGIMEWEQGDIDREEEMLSWSSDNQKRLMIDGATEGSDSETPIKYDYRVTVDDSRIYHVYGTVELVNKDDKAERIDGVYTIEFRSNLDGSMSHEQEVLVTDGVMSGTFAFPSEYKKRLEKKHVYIAN